MIAVDTNVLVHAHRADSPKHEAAVARLTAMAEGSMPWAIPVFCLGEFLRVLTHPRLFERPHTRRQGLAALERLLDSPSLVVLNPDERFPALLMAAVDEAEARGNLVYDAQIVALCRQWGIDRLLSEDRDFDRWQNLRLERLEPR